MSKYTTKDKLKAFHAAMDYIACPPPPKCPTCKGKGYVECKVFTEEPASYMGIPSATRVTCPECQP